MFYRIVSKRMKIILSVYPDKALLQSKSTDMFPIFPCKHMLLVLIRSDSLRRF